MLMDIRTTRRQCGGESRFIISRDVLVPWLLKGRRGSDWFTKRLRVATSSVLLWAPLCLWRLW